MEYITLNNGIKIPILGYGVYQVSGEECERCVLDAVIPKSVHKERMQQNMDVFDFKLDEQDMDGIRALDEGESLFFSHYDPATVEMMVSLHR